MKYLIGFTLLFLTGFLNVFAQLTDQIELQFGENHIDLASNTGITEIYKSGPKLRSKIIGKNETEIFAYKVYKQKTGLYDGQQILHLLRYDKNLNLEKDSRIAMFANFGLDFTVFKLVFIGGKLYLFSKKKQSFMFKQSI